MKKLGIIAGACALALSAPVARAATLDVSADAKVTVKIGGHVTLRNGTYYCFGKKATITRPTHPKDSQGRNVYLTGDSDDVIVTTDGPDSIVSGGGRDYICSLGGDDDIRWYAGPTNKGITIDAGAGNDLVGPSYNASGGNTGVSVVYAGPGNDVVIGGRANDRLYGNEGDDRLDGNLGTDTCAGGDGMDRVRHCEQRPRRGAGHQPYQSHASRSDGLEVGLPTVTVDVSASANLAAQF